MNYELSSVGEAINHKNTLGHTYQGNMYVSKAITISCLLINS